MNQDMSSSLSNDSNIASCRNNADKAIANSIQLLHSLGKEDDVKH